MKQNRKNLSKRWPLLILKKCARPVNAIRKQKELEAEVIRLQKEIEVQETQIQNIEKFIQKAGQHVGIEELTPYVLHELVKAIYVDAPDKSSGKRRQHIHIQYDGLGFIPLNELLTSEKA